MDYATSSSDILLITFLKQEIIPHNSTTAHYFSKYTKGEITILKKCEINSKKLPMTFTFLKEIKKHFEYFIIC